MPIDAPVVQCLVHEIQQLLPVKIARIYQTAHDEFRFSCYGGGDEFALLFSLNPQYSRFHSVPDSRENTPNVSSFCLLLRKYFSGSRLIALEAIPFERIIKFTFETFDPIVGLGQKVIWLELTGRSANLIVCEPNNTIIDCLKRKPASKPGERDLNVDSVYELPATKSRWQPVTLTAAEFLTLFAEIPNEVILNDFFTKQWLGLSAPAIETICRNAGIAPTASRGELNDDQISVLYDSFNNWSEQLKKTDFAPYGIYKSEVLQDFVAFKPNLQRADCTFKPLENLNEAVAASLGINSQINRFREVSEGLAHRIKNNYDKNRRKLDKQIQEAKQAEKSEIHRITGELLNTYGYQVQKGMTSIALPNHYDVDGSDLQISLNPALSAHENAAVYYKKYQKAKKGQESIAVQIKKTEEMIDYWDSLATMVNTAATLEDLELIREELDVDSTRHKKATVNKSQKKVPESKPRQFTTPDGHTILVGRNNIQNDRLTFKIAAPTDWWFHTQKIPGSHVIVRLEPGTVIDDETIFYACQLAVFYSKTRKGTKVPVDYTQRKYVKKPQNASPGFVIYDNFRTGITTPDETVLNKLGAE